MYGLNILIHTIQNYKVNFQTKIRKITLTITNEINMLHSKNKNTNILIKTFFDRLRGDDAVIALLLPDRKYSSSSTAQAPIKLPCFYPKFTVTMQMVVLTLE